VELSEYFLPARPFPCFFFFLLVCMSCHGGVSALRKCAVFNTLSVMGTLRHVKEEDAGWVRGTRLFVLFLIVFSFF
jgi:hypothetical protein